MKRSLLCAFGLSCIAAVAMADEGKSLFNGKNLDGWKGDPNVWSVKDGAITGTVTDDKPLQHNTFLIWQENDPENFELRLKYKMKGNNSGIQYRSKVVDADQFIVGGYQADIDDSLQYTGINYEERGRGILAERGQSVTINADGSKSVVDFATPQTLAKHIHKGEWNDYLVVAQGNKVQHFINGVLMSEVMDHEEAKAGKSGVIALQVHTGPAMTIQFKDIVLKVKK